MRRVPLRDFADIQESHGRVEEAFRALRRALQDDPTDALTLDRLGQLHQRRGEYDRAIGFYTRAVRQAPNHSTLQTRLAEALSAAGRREEADAAWQRVLALDPANRQARERVGNGQRGGGS